MAKVLVMAGGTGGHIFPALAIADELRQRDIEIVWLGAKNGMETRIVPNHQIPIECISITGLRGQKFITTLLIPWRLSLALWQTLSVIKRVKPDLVIGLGGFVTGPGGLVAWLLQKPLVIHEQNAIAGLTNRLLSRLAKKVLTAFPNVFPKQDGITVGNPVRKDIAGITEPNERFKTRLTTGMLNILVVGGSLGALRLNQVIPGAMHHIMTQIEKGEYEGVFSQFHVRHQSGRNKLSELNQSIIDFGLNSSSICYEGMEFIDDMAEAYSWADIVICRAGALTISELSLVGIGSILVPYPLAVDDHQTMNASYLSNEDAAFLIPQPELTESRLCTLISSLTVEKVIDMANRAKALAYPSATQDFADLCIDLIEPSKSKKG